MSVSAQVTICIHSLHIAGSVCLHVGDVLIRGFKVCLFMCLCIGGTSCTDAFKVIRPSESLL